MFRNVYCLISVCPEAPFILLRACMETLNVVKAIFLLKLWSQYIYTVKECSFAFQHSSLISLTKYIELKNITSDGVSFFL